MTRMDRRSRPQSIDRWIESANQKQVRQGSYARTARAEGWHTQAARSKKQKPFHIGVHAADPLLERPASIRLRTQASAGRLPSRSRVLPCLLFPAQTHLLCPSPLPCACSAELALFGFAGAFLHSSEPFRFTFSSPCMCMQTKQAGRRFFHCQVATEASCSLAVQVLSEPNRILSLSLGHLSNFSSCEARTRTLSFYSSF